MPEFIFCLKLIHIVRHTSEELIEALGVYLIEMQVGIMARQKSTAKPAEERATLGTGHLIATVDFLINI